MVFHQLKFSGIINMVETVYKKIGNYFQLFKLKLLNIKLIELSTITHKMLQVSRLNDVTKKILTFYLNERRKYLEIDSYL